MRQLLSSTLFFVIASQAAAQQPTAGPSENPTIVAQRLTPATSAGDFLTTFALPETHKWSYSVGFFSDFQVNPVTVRFVFNTDEGQQLGGDAVKVVASQLMSHVVGAFSFGRVEASFDAPFVLVQNGDGLSLSGGAGGGIPARGVGDPRFYLRAKAWSGSIGEDGLLSLGGVGGLSLPLGDEGGFLGEGGTTASIRAVGDLRWKQFHFAGNLGYLTRPERTFLTLVIDDEIFYRVAAAYQINPTIAAALEFYGGANADSDIRDVDSSHAEADLALRFQASTGLTVTGGVGKGLIAGIGNPDVRLFAGVRFQPNKKGDSDKDGISDLDDECPRKPETDNGVDDEDGCPDKLPPDEVVEQITDPNDEDADGIPNAKDPCPEQPEDVDHFEDEDGCPDLDNDKDGFKDSAETCDDEAEDKDGFEDEDGCIDPDNDKDEIADVSDKCPDQPEDKDNLADEDGCPELDADNDGFADTEEQCPSQAETLNGLVDDDGCPDEGASSLTFPVGNVGVITGAEKIKFQKGKVQLVADSFVVLDELLSRMRLAKGSILTITVSPEKAGKAAAEMATERAEILKRYLIGFGIEEERIITNTDTKNTGSLTLSLKTPG